MTYVDPSGYVSLGEYGQLIKNVGLKAISGARNFYVGLSNDFKMGFAGGMFGWILGKIMIQALQPADDFVKDRIWWIHGANLAEGIWAGVTGGFAAQRIGNIPFFKAKKGVADVYPPRGSFNQYMIERMYQTFRHALIFNVASSYKDYLITRIFPDQTGAAMIELFTDMAASLAAAMIAAIVDPAAFYFDQYFESVTNKVFRYTHQTRPFVQGFGTIFIATISNAAISTLQSTVLDYFYNPGY